MDILKDRQDIKKLIKNVCKEQEIQNYEITNVTTNQKGEGFLGQFFMVSIQDTDSDKQLHLAIKAAFIEDKVREMVPIRMSFENEIYFYSKVYPTFKQFEKERGVSATIKVIPKCLKVSMEEHSEMLALENLRVLDFEVFDKKTFLDDEHVSLIFKNYGRFHAYSFALRDQRPEEYEKLAEPCYNVYKDLLYSNNESFKRHLKECCTLVEGYLIPGVDDEVIKRYRKLGADGLVASFEKIITQNFDYSVILHGDCWSNNMMFKYEKSQNGKKLVDMRILDWQLIKVGSPVCDLSYSLYSGASKAIFDNLDKYLHIYYDAFSSFLKQLGSDPEKLFPFATLKEHWRKYSIFGLLMGFAIMKMKMTNKEDLIDFTDNFDPDELDAAARNAKFDKEAYEKIARGLLQHMTEIDVL